MKNFKKLIALMLVLIAGVTLVTSCVDDEDPPQTVKSSEKKVLVFRFDQVTPAITATIDHNLKTITAILPGGTNLNNLSPYIEVSEKAGITPASFTVVDFTAPVTYTVTAEDGSAASYLATITLNASDPILLETMDANRTLPDRGPGIDYIVNDMLYLNNNALLTVEPGVTIAFTSVYAGFNVGENAGLKMIGTAEKPIILTGPLNNDNKGAWAGILYNSARADNGMEYVQLVNAGTVSSEAAIYLSRNSSLRMNRSSVRGSLANGIKMNNGTLPVFNNNTISECENYPIWNGSITDLATIGSSNSLANNRKPFIYVDYGTNVEEENLTLSNPGVPILLGDNLFVYKDLNLEKGIILEFNTGNSLLVGTGGMITAMGDAQNPVIFRGSADEAGYWGGISIETSRNNRLEHCIISGGGSDNYSMNANISMWDGSRLTLSNVKLLKSSGYGFQFSGNINLTHSGVSFDQCAKGNVYDYDNEEVHTNLP